MANQPSNKDLLMKIHDAIYGSNPHPGILERLAKIEGKMGSNGKASIWQIIKTRGVEAVIIGGIVTVVILLALGKGDLGQVIELIRAVRGIG